MEKPFEVVYAETVTVTVTLDGVHITDAMLKVALSQACKTVQMQLLTIASCSSAFDCSLASKRSSQILQ